MKFEFKKPVRLKIDGVVKNYIGEVEFADEVVERENFVQRFAKFPKDIILIEEAKEVEPVEQQEEVEEATEETEQLELTEATEEVEEVEEVEQPQRKNKKK